MKKLIALLIALTVMLMPLTAFAAPGDATILRRGQNGFDGSIRTMVELDGTLYILSYDGIYVVKDGEDEPVHYRWDPSRFLTEKTDEDPEDQVDYEQVTLLAYEEDLYLIVVESQWVDDDHEERVINGAELRKISFLDDNTIGLEGDGIELDWDDMIESSYEYQYSRQITGPFMMDDQLYFTTYGDSGMLIMAYDLEDGTSAECALDVSNEQNISSICPYKDGLILMVICTYEDDGISASLSTYDTDSEETEEIFVLPTVGYSAPSCLVYSEEKDTLYYTMGGELHAITGMDLSTNQAVAEMSLESYSESIPIITEEGYIIASDYSTVLRRNPDPSLRAEKRLTVQNSYNDSINNANYDFIKTHGDTEVIMTSQVEDIVQAMMNQSSAVDVYMLYGGDTNYESVFTRGYMADLSGSEKISEFVQNTYPAIRSLCEKDGEILALPVEIYFNSQGYNPTLFEKISQAPTEQAQTSGFGLNTGKSLLRNAETAAPQESEAPNAEVAKVEVPSTWVEFFEALPELYEIVQDYPGITLFEDYMTEESARNQLFNNMLQDYMMYILQDGNEPSFDTPLFRELMAAFEAVDFTNLGLKENDEQDDGEVMVSYSGSRSEDEVGALFSSYAEIGAYVYGLEGRTRPMTLKLSDEIESHIIGSVATVFVNPYSKNIEEAIEFVEAIVDNMDGMVKIHISPEFNEPVKDPYYESNIKNYEEMIETAKRELENADEENKEAYQQTLEEYEGYQKDYMEKYMWQASAESIAAYREYAESVAIAPSLNFDNEGRDDFYTLLTQYIDGLIDVDAFIKGVDGKIRMMMLEGQ